MISILLPTDFSDNSKNAITYALEFFKHQKVEFFFMHAYQNVVYSHENMVSRSVYNEVLESIENTSLRNLESLLAEVKISTHNPRYSYHILSSCNTLVEAVNQISESKNIDLIVMGTTGKSNERRLKFGSNTFNVLKSVKCPVLAIPSHYSFLQLRHILLPTDYRIAYKQRELELLSTLAASYKSDFTVLYVSKNKKLTIKQEANQTILKENIHSSEVDFSIEKDKNIVLGIQNCIKNKKTELLVMVNTHHSFWENLLFESTIDNVGIDLKIPLFVMQNSKRASK